MMLLWGTLAILALCFFLIFQPYSDEYRLWYFPVGVGLGAFLVTANDFVIQRRLLKRKRCHSCHRIDVELTNIIEHGLTKYYLCDDCPKKHHFLLRRGGSIISAVAVIMFFVEPVSAHIIFLIGMLVFYLKRNGYENRLYSEQGRCYHCKKSNDTVRLMQTQHIPTYFVCFECPRKYDAVTTSEG